MNRPCRHRASHDDSTGFTLMELVIVIVCLGILSAIVIFVLADLGPQTPERSSNRGNAILQRDRSTVATHQIGAAASLLGEAAGDSTIAAALITHQGALTRSTDASRISFAGENSGNSYFNVTLRNRHDSLWPLHTCLVVPASGAAFISRPHRCPVR